MTGSKRRGGNQVSRLAHTVPAALAVFGLGACQRDLPTSMAPGQGLGAAAEARAESHDAGWVGRAGTKLALAAIAGAESFIVRRGPGGTGVVERSGLLVEQHDAVDSQENYWCDTVEECFRRCPEPDQAGGSAQCSCDRLDDGGNGGDGDDEQGQYWCTVTYYGPGEHPWEGGGGGGECSDERDALAAEYNDATEWPCTRFQDWGGTANFTWAELNGGWAGGNESSHRPYGFVTGTLQLNLQATRDAYGSPILITSGYRCPTGNSSTPDSSPTSNHMEGMAVDMWGLRNAWTAPEYLELMRLAFDNGGSLPLVSDYRRCRADPPGGTCGHLHINYL